MQYWDSDKIESESKKKSWIITIILNVALLLAFYFIVVWKEQIPPLPTFGLELNLGFTPTGSGDRNSPNAPSEVQTPVTEAAAPGEIAEAVTKPATPAPSPKTETAKPKTASKPTVNQAVTTKPSPIRGEEKATENTKKPEPVKTEPAKTVTTPAKAEAEETVQKAPEKPKVDQRAIFGAGGTSGKGTKAASGGAEGSSTEKGDAGDPKGTVDGRAIMGEGSGKGVASGAGYSLDLAGWDFASKPAINDRVSTRNGKIVFKITVDDAGKIVQAVPLEYNVSNEVLAYYRQVVNQINFKKQGGAAADFSSGKITFVIKID
ncbi:energy transducer TonB [Algoriphagus marinus]|uniref:energy transducer TonB n=1 Tax=Algoriphagus marinus TaxID=1925762 RepID=UPI00094B7915|nr:energy transducer TonB [Algoriphagus marinus]